MCGVMSKHPELLAAIEAAASEIGIAPSTVGERAGQGGKFYSRLKSGCRVWPETERQVRERIHEMLTEFRAKRVA